VLVTLVTALDSNGSGNGFPGSQSNAPSLAPTRCVASDLVTSRDHGEPLGAAGRPGRAPLPLLAAAVLVGLQAVGLVVYGLLQLSSLGSGRATMVLTTAVFFVVYGGALGVFAWLLRRLRSWTRAPVVLAQLIWLGVAWSFRGGSTTGVAVALAVMAAVVLGGVFHPDSMRAVEAADPHQPIS
jgi:hypothetical protein